MGHSKIVGAIEIGTSKIAQLLERLHDILEYHRKLLCTIKWCQKGVIEDLKHRQIVQGKFKAENEAGAEIEEIYLAHTGHIWGSSTLDNSGFSKWVTKADVKKQKRMHASSAS